MRWGADGAAASVVCVSAVECAAPAASMIHAQASQAETAFASLNQQLEAAAASAGSWARAPQPRDSTAAHMQGACGFGPAGPNAACARTATLGRSVSCGMVDAAACSGDAAPLLPKAHSEPLASALFRGSLDDLCSLLPDLRELDSCSAGDGEDGLDSMLLPCLNTLLEQAPLDQQACGAAAQQHVDAGQHWAQLGAACPMDCAGSAASSSSLLSAPLGSGLLSAPWPPAAAAPAAAPPAAPAALPPPAALWAPSACAAQHAAATQPQLSLRCDDGLDVLLAQVDAQLVAEARARQYAALEFGRLPAMAVRTPAAACWPPGPPLRTLASSGAAAGGAGALLPPLGGLLAGACASSLPISPSTTDAVLAAAAAAAAAPAPAAAAAAGNGGALAMLPSSMLEPCGDRGGSVAAAAAAAAAAAMLLPADAYAASDAACAGGDDQQQQQRRPAAGPQRRDASDVPASLPPAGDAPSAAAAFALEANAVAAAAAAAAGHQAHGPLAAAAAATAGGDSGGDGALRALAAAAAAAGGGDSSDTPAETVRFSRIITCKTYLKRLNITQPMAEHLLPFHDIPRAAARQQQHANGNGGAADGEGEDGQSSGSGSGSGGGGHGATGSDSDTAQAPPRRAAAAAGAAAAGGRSGAAGSASGSYAPLFREWISLVDGEGATWRVQYEGVSCRAQKHLRLTSGWRDYVRAHSIAVGDGVVFERRGDERHVLHVSVARGAGLEALKRGSDDDGGGSGGGGSRAGGTNKRRRVSRRQAAQRLS